MHFVFVKMPKDGIEYTKSSLALVDVEAVVKNFYIGSSGVVNVPKDKERSRYPLKGMVEIYVDYLRQVCGCRFVNHCPRSYNILGCI